ncbi:MAG: hypothetical protein ACJ790_11485 [Myxococcaceae bacterium]
MFRTLFAAAAVATFALSFVPSSAKACEGDTDGDCPCKHGKKDTTADAAKVDAKVDAKTAVQKASTTDKKAVKKDTAAKPVQQTSVMDQVDQILAAKCPCSSQADCTCKKGDCKCSKCGAHHRGVKMIETIRDSDDSTELPQNARYDATAGIFI